MPPKGKGKGGGKGKSSGAGDPRKCANDGCTKPGLLRCAGCMSVKYCSAACQKVHWKQGGHKQECSAICAKRAGAGAADGSEDKTCIICLSAEPPPIQSGCACRGAGGLAHVECRAEAAAHRMAEIMAGDRWWGCGMCGQFFSGAMRLGLAETWWSRSQGLPDDDECRLAAANNLANTLIDNCKFTEAEALLRETLAVQRRVVGPDHYSTLKTLASLASALNKQGKSDQAEVMGREVLALRRRVLGPEDPDTLATACNLAMALQKQGGYVEAEKILREVLEVNRRVLGPNHVNTMSVASNLANALFCQDKYAEAETILRQVLAGRRRVLGPQHPHTVMAAESLAFCVGETRGAPSSSN
jgi:hypothetical protein